LAWRYHFDPLLESVDRHSIDALFQLADGMFGRPSNWSDSAIRSGRKWSKLRKLAEEALQVVKAIPNPDTTSTQHSTDLHVQHYDSKRIDNTPDPEELVEDEHGYTPNDYNWHALREALLYTCARHGHVGPDDPNPNPDFWIVDDRYNEERHHYMEAHNAAAVSPAWMGDLAHVLHAYPGWGVGVSNIREDYLLLFADRLMVSGRVFRACREPEQVLAAMRRAIKH
jgi:hypothetical protein